MKSIVIDQPDFFGSWVMATFNVPWFPGRGTAIGLMDGDEILGATVFDSYNGASVCMHVASSRKGWISREYLRVVFTYVFGQLGCQKAVGLVGSGNHAARQFDESLGFVLEATLTNAHPDGDLLLYTMSKDQCRWIKQRNVKEPSWENQAHRNSQITLL